METRRRRRPPPPPHAAAERSSPEAKRRNNTSSPVVRALMSSSSTMETRRLRPPPPPASAERSSPEAKWCNNTSSPAVVEETYSDYMDRLTEEEKAAEYERFLAGPPPQEIMISFVDRLVRAHQFFQFRDYLEYECQFETNSKWKDVFLDLIKKPERNLRFNKLDEKTIMDAIYERIRELQVNEILRMKFLGHPDFPPIPEERRLEMFHQYKQWRQVDHIPFSDPTLELINQARREHLLDHNPQVELDKIKERDLSFYEAAFMFHTDKPLEYSEKTVMVVNLTTEHTDEKLIDLLSVCGEVEKIERTSSFVWPEVAHVTFKNSEAARVAPLVVDPHLISVLRMCEECFVPESVVEKEEDVGSIYKEALVTYSGLCSQYALQHVRFKGPRSTPVNKEVVIPPVISLDDLVRNLKCAGGKNVSAVLKYKHKILPVDMCELLVPGLWKDADATIVSQLVEDKVVILSVKNLCELELPEAILNRLPNEDEDEAEYLRHMKYLCELELPVPSLKRLPNEDEDEAECLLHMKYLCELELPVPSLKRLPNEDEAEYCKYLQPAFYNEDKTAGGETEGLQEEPFPEVSPTLRSCRVEESPRMPRRSERLMMKRRSRLDEIDTAADATCLSWKLLSG